MLVTATVTLLEGCRFLSPQPSARHGRSTRRRLHKKSRVHLIPTTNAFDAIPTSTPVFNALTMPTASPSAFAAMTAAETPSRSTKPRHVVGLGEAMIDFSAFVSEEVFKAFNIEKGGRRVVGIDERLEIQRKLGEDYTLRAGSSINNTLVAMAQLSRAEGDPLRLSFAGSIGTDRLGDFYRANLKSNGVEAVGCGSDAQEERLTGCVIVLTTPDAQRSFLVYPGDNALHLSDSVRETIADSRVLMIEGYLFGLPNMTECIREAVSCAKQNGTLVAVTAGATEVVKNALDELWGVIEMGVDIFLCNHSEAVALLGESCAQCCAHQAIERLSAHFPVVAVTDGSSGSYIASMGQLQTVPPYWMKDAPVDTCGAGDVYAAGLLHGFLRGYDLYDMGLIASRSASAIIAKHGAQLHKSEAEEIMIDLSNKRAIRLTENLEMELKEA